MKYVPVCLALMTPGCAVYERTFPSYEYSMVTVCRTAADTIDVLAVRHMQDPLTADQIGTVKDAIDIIENVCMQEDIPEDKELLDAARQSVIDLLEVEEQTR